MTGCATDFREAGLHPDQGAARPSTEFRLPSATPMSGAPLNRLTPLRRANPLLGTALLFAGLVLLIAALGFLFLVVPILVLAVLVGESFGLVLAVLGISIGAIAAVPVSVLMLDRGSALFDRRFTGRCPRCDYDLRGLASRACPECGSCVG